MKLKSIIIPAIALSLFLPSCGFYGENSAHTVSTTATAPTVPDDVYSSLINLLENEIDRLKSEQSISAAEYEKKLKELEKLIAAENATSSSTNDNPSDTIPDPSPFTYTKSGSEAIITGYSGKYSVLVIPEKIDGLTVTEISDSVFEGHTELVSVSIPAGVKKLGWFVFAGCTSLISATLPSGITEIGYDSFAHCTKLTIHCQSNSYAEQYAKSYGISYVSN